MLSIHHFCNRNHNQQELLMLPPPLPPKNLKLTFENAIPNENLRVVRPSGQLLKVDQIVRLVMTVHNAKTRKGNESGVIVDRGEALPEDMSYIVWDLDRFEKFS